MQQLEAVNATESPYKFLKYIAHELANPLNGMLMSVELIAGFAAATPRAANEIGDLVKILSNETNRLALLLKELHGSGVLRDVDRQPTSLAAEISDLLALESACYEQRGVRVNLDVPVDLPPVVADKNKLRQVLLNLCKNAVEAMPDGGTLTIRGYAMEAWSCLEITDTGNGIAAGMPVFEPAVTDKARGSGLGLAIVREIVQQHEGTVSYTTQLGKGTTFHLKFPIPAATPANVEDKPQACREVFPALVTGMSKLIQCQFCAAHYEHLGWYRTPSECCDRCWLEINAQENYRPRSQYDQYRWWGDSSRARPRDSGPSLGSIGALSDITDRGRVGDALLAKDGKSPMEIASSCSAALRLVGKGLLSRAATQGVNALFSTAFEYSLEGIKASPKLFAGNLRWGHRPAWFKRRLDGSNKSPTSPCADSTRKTFFSTRRSLGRTRR